jgi:hypothetical protein
VFAFLHHALTAWFVRSAAPQLVGLDAPYRTLTAIVEEKVLSEARARRGVALRRPHD